MKEEKPKSEIVLHLLQEGNLSHQERATLASVFPDKIIPYSYIVDVFCEKLANTDCFPLSPFTDEFKRMPREGIYIYREPGQRYNCLALRTGAINPEQMVEQFHFSGTVKEVALYYLKWELDLPGRLEGFDIR